MQKESLKKAFLAILACATIGVIYYDVTYNDHQSNNKQRTSNLIDKIDKIKKTSNQQKQIKPSMQKGVMNKPAMQKGIRNKPAMQKGIRNKPAMQKGIMNHKNNRNDQIAGIGSIVIDLGLYPYIKKNIPGSPAEKSGLSTGDKILTIDGLKTNELSIKEVFSAIRGNVGTIVELKVEKQNGEILLVSIERA
ncbi:MAG: C-terminal processing protease CtpA/Prc, contains a PDZ domain [Chloroflexi bacterium]|nr:MAG: C-terminal processing protease CtpA/Prc, contains a PDZ domain [Chloroflexota bacterium]